MSNSRRWNVCAVLVALGFVAATASLSPPLLGAQAPDKAGKKQPAQRLSYHDGTADGKRSVAGTGEMVSFTLPEEDAKVAGIRIHGARYGYPQAPKENVMIYFMDDAGEAVATRTAPYARFKRGEPEWVEIKFAKPVEVPRDFWVCVDFRAEQTKGVYVSIDQSTDGTHSGLGLPGNPRRAAGIDGDWMIEVVLAP